MLLDWCTFTPPLEFYTLQFQIPINNPADTVNTCNCDRTYLRRLYLFSLSLLRLLNLRQRSTNRRTLQKGGGGGLKKTIFKLVLNIIILVSVTRYYVYH